MLRKLITLAAISSLSLFLTVGSAQAGLKLRLTDQVNPATVTVNGAGGTVAFIGPLGNWAINITAGTSKPATGTAVAPNIKLLSVNSQNSAPGDMLLIELTDTDFNTGGSPLIPLLGSINGTDVHLLQYKAWADDGNNEFAKTTLIGDTGPFMTTTTQSFSLPVPLSGTYSLTMEVLITHSLDGQETSFDAELTRVPEPGTLALLGLGLGLVGVSVRRRRG